MRLFGSLSELVATVFRKNNQSITLRPNQTTTYTADRDVQLPQNDAAEVIVGRTSADQGANRLKNKDFEDSTVAFADNSDATKKMQFELSGLTTATTRTLTVPDASDTLAVLATAQTLTNKTINADNNTITNIDNNEIKALAAIDATKIADGSVDNTEFQRLGTAGTAGAGNLVTTDGTQELSNKTLAATTVIKSGVKLEEAGGSDQLTFQIQGQTGGANLNIQDLAGVSQSVVLTVQAATLTNKTIDGSVNTISNINLASQVTGTLPIGNGGTGQTTQTSAFDALAPTTTKGDLIAHNGTDNVRVPVGTNGYALVADSGTASGLNYAAVATDALNQFNMKVGNVSNLATAFDTSTLGDISADSTTGLNIKTGVIVNADVNASAAIAGTKISPNFGSQAVSTTGSGSFAGVSITGAGALSQSTSLSSAQATLATTTASAYEFKMQNSEGFNRLDTDSDGSTVNLYIATNSAAAQHVFTPTRLGVGTIAPGFALDVRGTGDVASIGVGDTSSNDGGILVKSGNAAGGESYVALQRNTTVNGFLISDGSNFALMAQSSNPLQFRTNGNNTRVSIDSTGDMTFASGLVLNVDTIENAASSGAPNFTHGLKIANSSTLSTYTQSTTSTTFSFNGGGGTSGSVTLRYSRVGDWVTIFFPAASATSGTGSNTFTSNTALDAFARPTAGSHVLFGIAVRNNGGASASPGVVQVSSAGIITILRDGVASAWTNSASGGIQDPCVITYYVGTGS